MNPLFWIHCIFQHFEPWPAHYFLSWNLLTSMVVFSWKLRRPGFGLLFSSWEGVTLPINVSYCETLRMWGCSQGCFWWFDKGLHAAFCLCPSWLILHLNQCFSSVNHSFTFISYPLIFPSPSILIKYKSIFYQVVPESDSCHCSACYFTQTPFHTFNFLNFLNLPHV